MQMRTEELADGVKAVFLTGRMDNAGTQEINASFSTLTDADKPMIAVDLSEVSFLASIGIRTLVSSARAVANRGGAMALANPQPLVAETLQAAGIDSIIPIYTDVAEAGRELLALNS